MAVYRMLNTFLNFALKSIRFLMSIFFLFMIACGGSSDSDDPTEPPTSNDFPQKIQILGQTSTHLVFSVEVATGRFELYSFNLSSGQRFAISDFYSANNGLRPFSLSSDGTLIGYRADKDLDGTDELYTNLIEGASEAQVTDSIGTSTSDNSGTTVHYNWQWIFGSTSLIFRSDPDADGIFEIQTASFDGSSLATVSADLSVTCMVEDCWKTASQGNVITFMVESINQNSEVEQNLFRVLSDASGLTQLNQSVATDTRLLDWQWSNDGALLAFIRQDIGSPPVLELVDPTTFIVTPLSSSGASLGVAAFAWAPDDSRIAFSEDGEIASSLSLYSVLPDGTDRHRLIDTSIVAAPQLFEWAWSPDSTRVAFRADQNLASVFELFTVDSDGQFHRKMNPPMSSQDSINPNWQWSPDSTRLAFHANIETIQVDDELYSATADGSSRIQLNTPISNAAALVTSNSLWTSDGVRMIYQISDLAGQTEDLYSVLANGTDQARINDSLAAGQSIHSDFQLAPNNSRIVYQVVESDNSAGLQLADINGNNRVNVRSVGNVSSSNWSLDSSRVFYVYLSENGISEQLFSVLADGTGTVQIY